MSMTTESDRRQPFINKAGCFFLIQVLAVLGLSILVRVPFLDNAPIFDELYHILAARSWSLEGTLRIADGEYTRARLYTIAVSWFNDAFGESLVSSRLPSLLAGSLHVAAVYAWTRSVGGNLAAWIAAGLFCISPIAIDMSDFTRFYALQALFFSLGTGAVYALVTRSHTVFAACALLFFSALAFTGAVYLSKVTLIGICALGAWVLAEKGPDLMAFLKAQSRLVWLLIVAAVLALATAAIYGGFFSQLVELFQGKGITPLRLKDARFYHWLFMDQYPTLWSLLPVAIIAGLALNTRPAKFCAVIFCASLVVFTVAGPKAERYIYIVLPFLFVLWGIAGAEAIPRLGALTAAAIQRLEIFKPWPAVSRAITMTLLAVAVLGLVISNAGMAVATLKMYRADTQALKPDWVSAQPILKSWFDQQDRVIVVTSGLPAIYYLGRFDYEFSLLHRGENYPYLDFGLDDRTGQQVIASREALELIVSCFPKGLFLDGFRPGSVFSFDTDTGAFLDATAEPLKALGPLGFQAYVWDRPPGPVPPGCASLRNHGPSRL